MYVTPDQIVAFNRSALVAFQAAAAKSFEAAEKLTALNLAASRGALEESADQIKALFAAKDPKAFADLATASSQPAAEKAAAYARQVYAIASDVGGEIARLVERQVAEGGRHASVAIEAFAKQAPAGSEGVVTLVKSALSAAQTAYDQAGKAAKQAVEAAEAQVAAAAPAAGGASRSKKAA